MSERPSFDSEKDGDIGVVQKSMEKIDSMPIEERHGHYERFSALVLIRFLMAKNLMEKEPKLEDCKMLEGCKIETASGISHIFDVCGSKWQVFLERRSDCREVIEKQPELLNHPDYFKMDLTKPAKVVNRTPNFSN